MNSSESEEKASRKTKLEERQKIFASLFYLLSIFHLPAIRMLCNIPSILRQFSQSCVPAVCQLSGSSQPDMC